MPVTVVVSVWWTVVVTMLENTVVVDVTVVVMAEGAGRAGVGVGPGFGTEVGMSLLR